MPAAGSVATCAFDRIDTMAGPAAGYGGLHRTARGEELRGAARRGLHRPAATGRPGQRRTPLAERTPRAERRA